MAAYVRHGASLEYACELGFVGATVGLVFIDYHHRILPNVVTLPGILTGLALAGPRQTMTFFESLAGVAVGAGLLFVVAEVYFRVRHIEGLGMGDVKMMGMVGAFIGWKAAILTLFIGSLLGSVVGVLMMATKGKDLKTALPFGTFLGVAAVMSLFAGPLLVDWYTGLF